MSERRNGGVSLDGVIVRPGEIALVGDGSTLVSIVGSGVAVCLWSPQDHVAALAHFVEPSTGERDKARPRYGNVAVPEVVRMMRESGPCVGMEAQVFGGAQRSPGDRRGAANVEIAMRVLSRRKVSVVSRDVGGSKGRKIVFDGGSGHVAVVKVHALRAGDWEP